MDQTVTGGTAVFSHADVPVHARRALFMIHECKCMLNKEVSGSGFWETKLPEEENEQGGLVFEVAAAEHDADEDVPETAMQEQEQHTSVPEASAVSNDDPEEQHEVADVGAAAHMLLEEGAQGSSMRQTKKSKHARVQLFQVTVSVRDDWLHRGPDLYDMDLNTYVSQVEREEKAFLHAAPHGNAGLLIPFDAHYKLAGNYAQQVSGLVSLPATWVRTLSGRR